MPSGIYQRSYKELKRIKKLRIGKQPWNKGIAHTKKTKEKISIKRKKRIEPIRTQKWKDNISGALTGKLRPNQSGSKNHNWKGGKYKDGHGYIMLNIGVNTRRLEHLFIMEKFLNRKLKLNEKVHHKDGIKINNKISNLHLFSSHSEHNCYEQKILRNAKLLLCNKITLNKFKNELKL